MSLNLATNACLKCSHNFVTLSGSDKYQNLACDSKWNGKLESFFALSKSKNVDHYINSTSQVSGFCVPSSPKNLLILIALDIPELLKFRFAVKWPGIDVAGAGSNTCAEGTDVRVGRSVACVDGSDVTTGEAVGRSVACVDASDVTTGEAVGVVVEKNSYFGAGNDTVEVRDVTCVISVSDVKTEDVRTGDDDGTEGDDVRCGK